MMRPVTSSPALPNDRASASAAKRQVAKWPFRCTSITASHVGLVDVEAHRVAEDAGVVHEDVEPAEFVDRPARRGRPRPRKVATSSPLATACTARGDDLVDDGLRGRVSRAAAFDRGAEVVDDHAGAVLGEQACVPAADAAAGAGDDRDLALENAHPTLLAQTKAVPRDRRAERVRVSP